jgi:hypothetical protein
MNYSNRRRLHHAIAWGTTALACLSTVVVAQEQKEDSVQLAIANCRALKDDARLNALRSRMPIKGEEPTQAMRAYDRKANVQERAALEVYREIEGACSVALAKTAFPEDVK